MDDRWLDGSTVLVTGATGFIGGHLTAALMNAGANVVALADALDERSTFARAGLRDRTLFIQARVDEPAVMEGLFKEHAFDAVFHLAAQTIVPRSLDEPWETFESNVRGTYVLLEAVRAAGIVDRCRVVIASSDKAYGSHGDKVLNETAALRGGSPYDASKSCTDLIAQSYARTYGMRLAITRCGNVYGPGDLNFSRLLPGVIRDLLRGERPLVRSDGSPVREYLYVDDAVDAYLRIGHWLGDEANRGGEAFNFAGSTRLSVLQVVNAIRFAMDRPDLEPRILNQAPGEIPYQGLNASKAKRTLGWAPRTPFDVGVMHTVRWCREALQPAEPGKKKKKKKKNTGRSLEGMKP